MGDEKIWNMPLYYRAIGSRGTRNPLCVRASQARGPRREGELSRLNAGGWYHGFDDDGPGRMLRLSVPMWLVPEPRAEEGFARHKAGSFDDDDDDDNHGGKHGGRNAQVSFDITAREDVVRLVIIKSEVGGRQVLLLKIGLSNEHTGVGIGM